MTGTQAGPTPSRTAGAIGWAFVMNWGQRGIAMVATFVLAAMIGPRNFGVVAIALLYVQFMQLLLEAGLGTAVVQRENLEPGHVDTAFWLNLAFAVALTCIGVAVGGYWADANGAPEADSVIAALTGLVLVAGVAVVPTALLQRGLEFKKLALVANVGALAGVAAGVSLALAGAGIWALVALNLTTEVAALLVLLAVGSWRPHLRFSRRHARELLGYSVGVFLANLAGFFNRRADALLMGLFFGPLAVGLYRLADRLVDVLLELTLRPVGAVALPVFSRLQDDRERLGESVASFLRTAALVTIPPLLVLAGCAPQVLQVAGPEWEPAATALAVLCLVGIAKGFLFFTGPLLFAVARTGFRALMLWSFAALSVGTAAAVGLVLEGSSVRDQLLGMAGSRAALFLLVFLPLNWLIVARIAGLRLRDVLPSLGAPLAAGAGAFAVGVALDGTSLADGASPVLQLVVVGLLTAGTAAAILLALDRRARAAVAAVVRRVRGRTAPPPYPGVGTVEPELSSARAKGVRR